MLAADMMLVNLADTPVNRAMFGSTGTAYDFAPLPQLRIVALTARADWAMLGSILGGAAGEQILLKLLVRHLRCCLQEDLARPCLHVEAKPARRGVAGLEAIRRDRHPEQDGVPKRKRNRIFGGLTLAGLSVPVSGAFQQARLHLAAQALH